MKTAEYWHARDDGKVECELCPHGCVLGEGATGLCRVRSVRDGQLHAIGYGLVSSAALDPIEKKPLYHFHPGTAIFSIGGWGCNFACPFCQNWTISQQVLENRGSHPPGSIVQKASAGECSAIAYTYNEPLVGFEFVRDCSDLAASKGLANVLVTNGYIRPAPGRELLKSIDALNIDIKSMDEEFYRKQCRARLGPVLEFAQLAVSAGAHVEITNLIIPGLNDGPDRVKALAVWVARHLGDDTPLHLSAYRPQYKMKSPATAPASLEEAYRISREHLKYVYLGNVAGPVGRDTDCPSCGALLIARRGYTTSVKGLEDGRCSECGEKVRGVFPPAC